MTTPHSSMLAQTALPPPQPRPDGGARPGLVSIIMPTHNANPNYLREAIESCIEQTHRHWELIIVDDGSNNDSPFLIADYAASEPRIRVVRHPHKRRLPAALNTGIEHAGGDYLTWLSDDDRFRPQALERMLACLRADPAVDIVYCDYSLMNPDGSPGPRMRVGPPEELGIHKPVGICYLATHEAFARTGFREEFFLAEDLDFWVRAFMRYRVAPLHEDLALYRQHEATLTRTHARTRVLQVHRRILDHSIAQMHWLDASGRARAYIRLAKQLLAEGEVVDAASALAQALRSGPAACVVAAMAVAARRLSHRAELPGS